MIKLICAECGTEFERYPSLIRGEKSYCSRYCSGKNTYIQQGQKLSPKTQFIKKQKPHNYKGGTYTVSRRGGRKYVLIFSPDNPMADSKGYVREHRLVASKKIGRILERNEIVHHIDGNTLNNNPDNLQVMDKKEHDSMNMKMRHENKNK